MGYGGNGITFSQVASEIVSTTIDGQADSTAIADRGAFESV